jgi:hypothetical protein
MLEEYAEMVMEKFKVTGGCIPKVTFRESSRLKRRRGKVEIGLPQSIEYRWLLLMAPHCSPLALWFSSNGQPSPATIVAEFLLIHVRGSDQICIKVRFPVVESCPHTL